VRTITTIAASRRGHVRYGTRTLLFAVTAGLALMFTSAAGASAATARPLGASPAHAAARPLTAVESPAQRIGCYWLPEKPFFLTKNSDKMYAEGKITSCTKPAPSACRLEVELFAANDLIHGPFAVGWSGKSGKTNHWVTCKKLTVNTNAFICHADPTKNEFYTQIAGWEEIAGKILHGEWDSAKVGYYCFV
jgi:hypothetical protein